MENFTAYKNSYTDKAFQTPTECLLDEFQFLRKQLVSAINSLLLLPHLDMAHQCDYVREKLELIEQKALEYQKKHQEIQKPVPRENVILLKKAA